jgi:hypothetical protein
MGPTILDSGSHEEYAPMRSSVVLPWTTHQRFLQYALLCSSLTHKCMLFS